MILNKIKLIFLGIFLIVFMSIIYIGNLFFFHNEEYVIYHNIVEGLDSIIEDEIDKMYNSFVIENKIGELNSNIITMNDNKTYTIDSNYINNKVIYINELDKFYIIKQFDNKLYIKDCPMYKFFQNLNYYYYIVNFDGVIIRTNHELETDKFHSILKMDKYKEQFDFKKDFSVEIPSIEYPTYNFYYNNQMDCYIIYRSDTLHFNHTLVYFNILALLVLSSIFLIYVYKSRNYKNTILNKKELNEYVLMLIDSKGKILYANNVFKRMYRFKKNFFEDFDINGDYNLDVDKKIKVKYQNKYQKVYFLEFMIFKKGKNYLLIGDNNNLKYLDESGNDYDYLTGLYNKVALNNELTNIINNKAEYNNMLLLLLDIRDFSSVNKLYGSTMCDEIIITISNTLKKLKSKNIYRMDSDRFLILYTNVDKNDDIIGKFRIFLHDNLLKINVLNQDIYLKYYCAAYRYLKSDEDNAFDIIEKLHLTLKEAKDSNSLITTFDSNLNHKFNAQIEILKVLEKSIKNNSFEFYYQPQINLENNKMYGMEALIRFGDNNYKHISPATFIELAEKKGLISNIGDILIHNVFAFVSKRIPKDMHVSINVSVIQMMDEGFVSKLIDAYEKYNFEPGQIAIEITESVIIDSFHDVVQKLNLMKKHGFKIYIDDFGTGYSSLLYLKDLPIDAIKLDKQFISLIEIDENGKMIVQKIVELAHSLNLDVIAEGVETQRQIEILKEFNCKYIQGYYYSKPLKSNDLIDFINKRGE